jgi:hypothetical protein
MAVARTSSPRTPPRFGEALVGCDDHGAAFIPAGDELEEDFALTNPSVARSLICGVQAGLEREIEPVQRFVVWQARQLQRVAEPTALAEGDFFFKE